MLSKTGNLRERKQQWMRRVVMDAALELFRKDGFDRTTVDAIADAAGISRRSFFRYFANKDDLLGQEIVLYGMALSEAIASCPKEYSPRQVLHETVFKIATLAEAEPHTRPTLEISERSAAARHAQSSRLPEAQERVAAAYAKRLRTKAKSDVAAQLLAALTFSIIDVAVRSWCRGGFDDLPSAAEHALATASRLLSDPGCATAADGPTSIGKASARSNEKRKTRAAKIERIAGYRKPTSRQPIG
jgi:AcrR family transcriptional regulator